jgi:hypothetical protein
MRRQSCACAHIPNARTAEAAAAARLLQEAPEGIETAADLLRRAAEAALVVVESQDVRDLANDLPSAPTLEASRRSPRPRAATPAGRKGRGAFVAIKPDGSRAPFSCIHPIGGNVLCYLDLARYLAEVRRVQPQRHPTGSVHGAGWSPSQGPVSSRRKARFPSSSR